MRRLRHVAVVRQIDVNFCSFFYEPVPSVGRLSADVVGRQKILSDRFVIRRFCIGRYIVPTNRSDKIFYRPTQKNVDLPIIGLRNLMNDNPFFVCWLLCKAKNCNYVACNSAGVFTYRRVVTYRWPYGGASTCDY